LSNDKVLFLSSDQGEIPRKARNDDFFVISGVVSGSTLSRFCHWALVLELWFFVETAENTKNQSQTPK